MILSIELFFCSLLFSPIFFCFDLIAKSSLETCIVGRGSQVKRRDGSPCSQKLIIVVSVPSGGGGGEKLESQLVSKVSSEDGTSLLKKPIRISIAKSRSLVSYKLRKIGRVNYKPREQILYFNGCDDNIYSGREVCGTAILDGKKIPDSHGRCCKCGFWEKLKQSHQWARSNLKCGLIGVSESAHCMRLHPVFLHVFEFLPPQILFSITVALREKSEEGWRRVGEVAVGPGRSQRSLLDGQVRVELNGEFAPKTHFFTLHSKLLLVPDPSTAGGTEELRRGPSDWLVLDKEQVDLSGTQCNKVGVWFQAFRHQEQFCSLRNGSCLLNQAEDIWRVNDRRRRNGRSFRGLLSYYGNLVPPPDTQGGLLDYRVQFENQDLGRSQLVLTLSADELQFVVHNSLARIVSAYVEGFEALTQHGNAMLLVLNEGNLTASYNLGVYKCSPGIELPHGRVITLNPGASTSVNFTIYSHHPLFRENKCTAYLRNKRGRLLHEIEFSFETYSTCFCPAYCPCSCGNLTRSNSSLPLPGSAASNASMGNMTFARYLSEFCVNESEVTQVDIVQNGGGYTSWDDVGQFIDRTVSAIEGALFGGVQNFLVGVIRFLPLICLVCVCGISCILLIFIRVYKMVVNGDFSLPELKMLLHSLKNICTYLYQNFHILCLKLRSQEERSMGSFRAHKNSAFIRPSYCNGLCDGAKLARTKYRREMRTRLRSGLPIHKAWWDDPYNCTCMVNSRVSIVALVRGLCFFLYCCYIPVFWCLRHLFYHYRKRRLEKNMYKEFEALYLPEGDSEEFEKLYKNHKHLLLSDSDSSSESENDLSHVDRIEELLTSPPPLYLNLVADTHLPLKSLISPGNAFSLMGRLSGVERGVEGRHTFSVAEYPVQFYKQINNMRILLPVPNSLLPSDYSVELSSDETLKMVSLGPEYLCLNQGPVETPPPYHD